MEQKVKSFWTIKTFKNLAFIIWDITLLSFHKIQLYSLEISKKISILSTNIQMNKLLNPLKRFHFGIKSKKIQMNQHKSKRRFTVKSKMEELTSPWVKNNLSVWLVPLLYIYFLNLASPHCSFDGWGYCQYWWKNWWTYSKHD